MNILNIGPLEFILILVIMFILLGPEGMIKTARQIGTWIRQAVQSPIWREIMGYSREIRELPTKLVRESGLDNDLKDIRDAANAATAETQKTLQEASQEINQTIREAGSVEINLDVNAPATPASPVAMDGGTQTIKPPEPVQPPVID
jgi:sec-independent protein translocase protein TatB